MHGTSVYNTQVRVPLIIHPPVGASVSPSASAVSILDLTATLSAVAGAKPLGSGRDLRGPIAPAPIGIEWYGQPSMPPDSREMGRAVVMGQTKLIDRNGSAELYRLAADPHERQNQATANAAEVSEMKTSLPPLRIFPEATASGKSELSVDEVERLKALGYAD